jgi:hypothetical protein
MRHRPFAALFMSAVMAGPGAAQAWNAAPALALARRAIERRARAASDTALRDYKAHAHGFLFFLGQFGDGLTAPPRLIKADQLELEVYWKAPGLSKQRIVGWRDRADLPTDIVYHTDHLGIIQNNFGGSIRLGEGDEVRDVPHPLAPDGPARYDYALGDTTTMALPQRVVRVVALRVRPKRFDQAGIVGTVYVDAATADIVRLAFTFTAASYLDPELEDVSIVLDNALWEGRFWLPYRQELEIRRHARWLDVPARGIIRAHWIVDGYVFNVGLAASWFAGREITALPKAERDSFPWPETLGQAIQGAAQPLERGDLEKMRAAVERIAGRHALSGLEPHALGARRASDLVHANRVEGLTLGAGGVWRGGGEARELRALASYGLADRRPKARVTARARRGRATLTLDAYRAVRDVGDEPVIAPLLNSLAAQEFGDDYGDYYLATGARVSYAHGVGLRGEWRVTAGREAVASLGVRAQPASGQFAPNPPLGGPAVDFVELAVRRAGAGIAVRRDLHGAVLGELGRVDGGATYARFAARGEASFPLGATRGLVRAAGGLATADLPRHRAFVLGGRGTLLGDDFRRWGGRRLALVDVEWRVPVPFVSLAVGRYVHTPRAITVSPFAAAGWCDRPVAGTPWAPTPGARVTLGVALEWLGLVRLEAGMDTRIQRWRFALDVTREFWPIL